MRGRFCGQIFALLNFFKIVLESENSTKPAGMQIDQLIKFGEKIRTSVFKTIILKAEILKAEI